MKIIENVTKICIDCSLEKEIFYFYKKGNRCKSCHSLKSKEYYAKNKLSIIEKSKNYAEINSEKIKEYQKEYRTNKEKDDYNKKYYIKNKEHIKNKSKKYAECNKESIKEYKKYHYNKNKDKIRTYIREYCSNRRKNDILFKIKLNIRRSISISFKRNGYSKYSKTQKILGCSFDYFITYLESNFKTWMSWDNYGLYNGELNCGWDIDHIIPISSAKTEDDIIKLNHYSNLQPLCSYENRYIKKDLLL